MTAVLVGPPYRARLDDIPHAYTQMRLNFAAAVVAAGLAGAQLPLAFGRSTCQNTPCK